MNISDLQDKVPIRVYPNNDVEMVDWIDLDGHTLREPFFEDTINLLLRKPYNKLFRVQTPLSTLRAIWESGSRIKPSGFIFHISRCGSTLVSQMLAASDVNAVISEAPVIDYAIRSAGINSDGVDRIRWYINAFAPSKGSQRRFFVKFDSWSVLSLDRVSTAFPDVPWIFLYREPIEVIVSLLKQPGLHVVPGMIDGTIPDVEPDELLLMPREEYCARVIGNYCEAGVRLARHPMGKLINYSQLPDAVAGEIAAHFGVNFAEDDLAKITAVSKQNAKTPQVEFTPDSNAKRAKANDKVREAVDTWVRPFYAKLETLRTER